MPYQSPAFTFGEYTVRAVGEWERTYVQELIDGDPFHRENMTPDYFLKLQPGEEAMALEKNGRVILYFKTQTAVRVGMLFGTAADPAARRENQTALLEGLRWMEALLVANRFREIIFDTEGPELALFAKKHLGFEDAGKLLRRSLPTQTSEKTRHSDVGTVPTTM
jgi:hypothetical protein